MVLSIGGWKRASLPRTGRRAPLDVISRSGADGVLAWLIPKRSQVRVLPLQPTDELLCVIGFALHFANHLLSKRKCCR